MTAVVVVGAGIMGACISRHLALRGAKVTVVEAAPAPAAGATGKSWAWLNANAKQPRHYRDLNLRSMQQWQQQHAALCCFCGSLLLHDERPHDPGYPSRHIPAGPQLAACEPGLSPQLAASCHHAALFPAEGWCDPTRATRQFLADAEAAGARVLFGCKVDAVTLQDGRATGVTCSSTSHSSGTQAAPGDNQQQQQQQRQQQQQHLPADVVVVAAGVGAPELAAQLGYKLPLVDKPAAVVMTQPLQPGLLQHMVVSEEFFILQRSDGRFLIAETRPAPGSSTDTSDAAAQRLLQAAATVVPALGAARVEGMHVGRGPHPVDGHPVIGFLSSCSNAYVAVTHSGMTLAPLIGQLAAEEIMLHGGGGSSGSDGDAGGSSVAELLGPYRPGRDFEAALAAAAASGTAGLSWAATLRPSKR